MNRPTEKRSVDVAVVQYCQVVLLVDSHRDNPETYAGVPCEGFFVRIPDLREARISLEVATPYNILLSN